MTEVEFESDAFLSLLTDALRSGPGSPAWHEALRRLRAGSMAQADEYRLLVRAREHLESGKEYRSIRAGPGFAQKLMAAIEEDSAASAPPASAAVAIASAGIMLLVLLAIGYLLWTASQHRAIDSGTLLSNIVSSPDLDGPPADWDVVGKIRPEFTQKTMRYNPRAGTVLETKEVPGGGIVWKQSLGSDEVFSISVTVRIRGHIEPNLIGQVFVSDDPEFNPDNGTTPHELLWLLEGREAQVISPSGRIEARSTIPGEYGFFPLRVTVDHDQASVDLDGKRIWSGPNGLDHNKPRYIGLRFLRLTNDAGEGPVFQSLRVNTRPK